MEYLAQIAAFLVALFGITGDTWDRSKPGRIKFTSTGWVISILAVVILGVSVLIAYRADVEKRQALDQQQAVRSIARMEVCLAALRLKVVLDVLVSNATGALTPDGADIGLSYSVLLDPESMGKLKKLNLMEPMEARPAAGDLRLLDSFVSEEASEFVDLTNIALAKYSTFLDKELILNATRLSADNLVRRFMVTAEQVEQMRNNGSEFYPALWDHEDDSYYTVIGLLEGLLADTALPDNVLACRKPDFFM